MATLTFKLEPEQTLKTKTRQEFYENLAIVRGHLAAARAAAEGGDLIEAYAQAEKAQHAAFNAKNVIRDVLGNRLLTTERTTTNG